MKKALATILALVMALGLTTAAWADGVTCEGGESCAHQAAIGSTHYNTLAEAITAASDGDTIVLLKDVDASSGVTVGKKIVLDMNGKKLYNTVDIWDTSWSLISVQANGDLTITGNGTFAAKENDCYAVDVQDGGKVTIQNGTFIGNIHAVYVYTGTAIINGGTYTVQQQYPDTNKPYDFVLNCYDASRADGTAKITVNGGEFPQIDPSNCKAEGEGTNFVAADVAVAIVVDGNVTRYYAVGSAVIAAAANNGKSVLVTKAGPITGVDAGKSIDVARDVTGVTINGNTVAAGTSYTVPARYYYNSTTTTTDTKADDTKGSPKTFDAGIALYVGMALTSAAGVAFVGKKRED